MSITFILKNDFIPNVTSQVIYSREEIKFLSDKLIEHFAIRNSFFNKEIKEDIVYLNDFFKSSFEYLITCIHTGKMLLVNSLCKAQDILNLCKKLKLKSLTLKLTADIIVDTDLLFDLSLNEMDRKLVNDERCLRSKLFQHENIDFRDEDFEFLLRDYEFMERKPHVLDGRSLNPSIDTKTGYYTLPWCHQSIYDDTLNTERAKGLLDRILGDCPLVLSENLIMAGGCVNHVLTRSAPSGINDIDLFFVTKDKDLAEQILQESITRILENSYHKLIVRTENSISIQYGRLKIQFILRLYNSIAQVISGFDIDACCAAYDGKNFYAMPRYVRSVKLGYILVDPERRSKTYEYRLKKYKYRGFDIAFPGYNPQRVVNPQKGIASSVNKVRAERVERNSDYDTLSGYDDINSVEYVNKLQKYMNRNKCKTVPFIISKSLTKIITGKATEEEEKEFRSEKLIKGRGISEEQENINYNLEIRFPTSLGRLTFRTSNPGTQMTNSFHPIKSDWYADSYIFNV